MKISLIIAVYNGVNYIKYCLDSVLQQTFKDFECICINDGSSDDSLKILEHYASLDSRIKVINQPNHGCSYARNTGIKNAQAEFLAFLDQDDLLHPQALEMLYYMINKHQADVAAFTFQDVSDDYVMHDLPMYSFKDLKEKLIRYPFKYFFRNRKGSEVVIWTRLYRKSIIGDIRFPEDIQPAEDTIYTLKVFNRITRLVTTSLPLLLYRNSAISVMNKGITAKYINSHLKAGQLLYKYFISCHRLSEHDEKIMKFYISRIIYKTTISQTLRWVKNPQKRIELLDMIHPKLKRLAKVPQIFNPKLFHFRHRLVCWLFFHKFYRLARLFA